MSSMRFAPRAFARTFSSTPIPRVARVTLIGRLAATPELYTSPSGKEIIRYAVGINRGRDEKKQTTWWKVSSFTDSTGKLGEKLLNLPKGTQVFVEGDIWSSKYEGSDGQQASAITIAQTNIQVLRKPSGTEETETAIESTE